MTKPAAHMPEVNARLDGDTFTLTLGFPPAKIMAALTPHAKGHWRGKAAATSSLRARVAAAIHMTAPRHAWDKAAITYRFFFPDNIRRDEANMVQRMKPVVDGLVDGGLIVGDHWQVLSTGAVESAVDKTNPRIEIVVRKEGA